MILLSRLFPCSLSLPFLFFDIVLLFFNLNGLSLYLIFLFICILNEIDLQTLEKIFSVKITQIQLFLDGIEEFTHVLEFCISNDCIKSQNRSRWGQDIGKLFQFLWDSRGNSVKQELLSVLGEDNLDYVDSNHLHVLLMERLLFRGTWIQSSA